MFTITIIIAAVGIPFYIIMNPKYKKVRFDFAIDGFIYTEYKRFITLFNDKIQISKYDMPEYEIYDYVVKTCSGITEWYIDGKWVTYMSREYAQELAEYCIKHNFSKETKRIFLGQDF